MERPDTHSGRGAAVIKSVVIAVSTLLVGSLILVIVLRDLFSESTFFLVSGLLGLLTLTLVPLAVFVVIGINVTRRGKPKP